MTNFFSEYKSKFNKSGHFMLFLSFINCWPLALFFELLIYFKYVAEKSHEAKAN